MRKRRSRPESGRTPAKRAAAAKEESSPRGRRKDARKGAEPLRLETPAEEAYPFGTTKFPVVGIGASAGGLETFAQVLKSLPADTGMAFVLVQHLAPTHESLLTDLLSTHTRMPVTEVREGMRVKPNRVYVIPPNVNMGLLNGILHLVPRSAAGAGPHLPIDFFFRSLAEDVKGGAIGVILSGTASDGALGLRAIKAEGGITLVQQPSSAKFDGMPRAAIASGSSDFVLEPEAISAELAKIGRHPYLAGMKRESELLPEAEELLNKVFFILRSNVGLDFTYYKHQTIKRRIKRRMIVNKLERFPDYLRYLQANAKEAEALAQDILIHVTGFFRDPETFEALKKHVFPSLLSESRGDPIRIWVPGCSTGEEAYSIAIALLEYLESAERPPLIQIFATDVSERAIEKARSGFYAENIAGDVIADRLRRFFTKADGGYRIAKGIRDLCIFAKQDVTRDPPFSRLDLISCRNVMIYLGSVLQKRAMSVFHYALKPAGFLLLGSSETVGPHHDLFELKDKKHKIYAKRSAVHAPMAFASDYSPQRDRLPRDLPHVPTPAKELEQEIDRVLLERFSPPGVLVTREMEIVQVRGQTGRYLEPSPGQPTMNLIKMAREGLGFELRTAIHSAQRKKQAVKKQGIRVKQNHHVGLVDIEVLPVKVPSGAVQYLILFRDSNPQPMAMARRKQGRGTKPPDRPALRRLEQELSTTRDYLQSIIQDQEATNEELQSANEEILSSNEELQSTNEELETAKEELQSTNEELNTVNDELQTRNQELSQLNSDLQNLLTNVHIPIVIVGNDLKIRRFTPVAERLFNLIPGDIGRPIGDIKPSLDMPDLPKVIHGVIDAMSVHETQVKDKDGRWYAMRIRPYKSVENKIDGAVVAFVDIDNAKRNGQSLHSIADHAATAADLCGQPFLVLEGFMVRRANLAFYKSFALAPAAVENKSIYDVGDGRWKLAALRTLLEDVLVRDGQAEDYKIELESRRGGRRTLQANARRIKLDGSEPIVYIAFDHLPPK